MVDHPGRMLVGRYRLLDRIGSGGMGTVWRSRDEVLHREVAVKEIRFPPELDEEARADFGERAMREARAAARLDHPGIIDVHDVVFDDGRPWIVMRLVPGRSLDRLVADDGPLPPRRVAEIGTELLDALEAAHARGILHRDLKPANVLVGENGRVVLTDFGIASMADAPQLTQTGALIGSPGYISPERLKGERASDASDLWSLGATLYYAVEGVPAYTANGTAALIGAVLTRDPRRPVRAGPLAPALLGLLVKDPARRLDATAARARLRSATNGPARQSSAGRKTAGYAATRPVTVNGPEAGAPPGAPTESRAAGAPTGSPTARQAKKGQGGGPVIVFLIALFLLNQLRLHAATDGGRFAREPGCLSIVGDELSRLVPRAVTFSTTGCDWKASTGVAYLHVFPLRYARSLGVFSADSAGEVAHKRLEERRRNEPAATATVTLIGEEAYSTTQVVGESIEVGVAFRLSNLTVKVDYTRYGENLDSGAVRSAVLASAQRMAGAL